MISYKKSNNVAEQFKFLGTQDATKVQNSKNFFFNGEKSVNTDGVEVQDNWFESLDFTGISRNADGTINTHGFLVLTEHAKTGSSIGGTASEEVVPGEETDGSIHGNELPPVIDVPDVPGNGSESGSGSEASDSSSSGSSSNQSAAALTTIEEMDTPLAATPLLNGLESVNLNLSSKARLNLAAVEKYRGRNIYLLAHLGNGVGFTINAGEMTKEKAELELGFSLLKKDNFAEQFDTYHLKPFTRTTLSYAVGVNAHVGEEYAGKVAYIFQKNELTNKYEIAKIMKVSENGNVGLFTNKITDVMILIAK